MKNKTKILKKNGDVTKAYAKKIWDHVSQATIDSINEDVSDDDWMARCDKFTEMLNDIPKG